MPEARLFITGINGKIGRILRAGLADTYDIYGLDVDGPFDERVHEVDIADEAQVLAAMQRVEPFPYLIHLAADPRVEAPWESVLANNIVGTHNVFEAARQAGVKKVVFASSNHVTGAYGGLPGDEYLHKLHDPPRVAPSDPIRPDGEYGVSKAYGEALARYFTARWGISFICLRIGVVLGDDRPVGHPWFKKGWLSHRDLVQLVDKSLSSNVVFGIYYGVSNNKGTFFDISNARLELGYKPKDDAALYWDDEGR